MWLLGPSERLHDWKEFRNKIGTVDVYQAIVDTCHLWSYAPYVNYYLPPEKPEDWPDPWVLLYENYYCDLAKTLGMLYTLYLSNHYGKDINELEIKIFKDRDTKDVFNTVWVDQGKYILNFSYDTVVNKTLFDENLILVHCYSVDDLKLDLY